MDDAHTMEYYQRGTVRFKIRVEHDGGQFFGKHICETCGLEGETFNNDPDAVRGAAVQGASAHYFFVHRADDEQEAKKATG